MVCNGNKLEGFLTERDITVPGRRRTRGGRNESE
jgi:hypothetical protein